MNIFNKGHLFCFILDSKIKLIKFLVYFIGLEIFILNLCNFIHYFFFVFLFCLQLKVPIGKREYLFYILLCYWNKVSFNNLFKTFKICQIINFKLVHLLMECPLCFMIQNDPTYNKCTPRYLCWHLMRNFKA